MGLGVLLLGPADGRVLMCGVQIFASAHNLWKFPSRAPEPRLSDGLGPANRRHQENGTGLRLRCSMQNFNLNLYVHVCITLH